MEPVLYVDMFAGCKGFEYAIREAGIPVSRSVTIEKCKWKNRVNRFNYPDSVILGDANECTPERIIQKLGGRADIFTMGWPCQGNSIAGERGGHTGDKRSGMFFKGIEFILQLQPKIIVAENVRGLISVNSGVDFIEAIRLFTYLGESLPQYELEMQLFDSVSYTGQSRQRVYFAGYLRGALRTQVFPLFKTTKLCIKTIKGSPRENVGCLLAKFGRSRWDPNTTFILTSEGIRFLRPVGFEWFQGFPRGWTEKGINERGKEVKMSDYRRWEMLGDAITTKVAVDIFSRIKEVWVND